MPPSTWMTEPIIQPASLLTRFPFRRPIAKKGFRMQAKLYTIGYEGAELGQFLKTLMDAGVEHVIDIRDVPVSRKRGFSKAALSTALSDSGIGYSHLKALGDPKPGREAMRRGDYSVFVDIYAAHLGQPAAQDALKEAVEIAGVKPSVLLCFERNPKRCHRTIVAVEMDVLGNFEIHNLGVNPSAGVSNGMVQGRVINLVQLM